MRAILSLVLILGAVGSSCSRAAVSSDDSDDRISVVASFYPLAYAAEQVGDGHVQVMNLTPPGAEPHDLELSPRDLEAIATADVVIVARGGFQSGVEEAVDAVATGLVVDALEGVGSPGSAGDDAASDDAHAWLDPSIYADIVDRLASSLGEVAPGRQAGAFDDAAASFRDRLSDLDRDFREGLADCRSRTMITNHAAFGSLAAAYGLEQESISGLSPGSEPDPGRIAELADEASEGTTIFTEDLMDPGIAETLAAEAGVGTAVLSPLEGLTDDQLAAGDDYLSVMRRNLETLRDGLDCA